MANGHVGETGSQQLSRLRMVKDRMIKHMNKNVKQIFGFAFPEFFLKTIAHFKNQSR